MDLVMSPVEFFFQLLKHFDGLGFELDKFNLNLSVPVPVPLASCQPQACCHEAGKEQTQVSFSAFHSL